ncbi:hypothetical protein LCGC14_0451070 [marine sediment metagenome]|uniref:Uncharacterized protein n=1 Tax=marine sediment metagenome TaxID=412755 RepID=A0A0F9V4L9_9ZZZZ
MDNATASLIASLRDVLEAVRYARNIKDAGQADDAMSDADVRVDEAIHKANFALMAEDDS